MTFIDTTALRRKHRALMRATDAEIAAELRQAAAFGEQHVARYPWRYKHRTGNLAASTEGRAQRFLGGSGTSYPGRRVVLRNTAPYARFLEYGTKAHAIHARRARFLRFFWKGAWHFRKSVWHPGTRPTRFLWRAIWASFRVAAPNIEREIRRLNARRW